MNKKKWLGDITNKGCDLCSVRLDLQEEFYDAQVWVEEAQRYTWGLVCRECFDLFGRGLGLGLGQMYSSKEAKREEA